MHNIAHISPQSRQESSSFIQAHLNGIKGNVIHYHGGYLPKFIEDASLPELNIFEKIEFRIKKKIYGLNREEYKVYKQFKKDKIDVIFAEYGPTGCAVHQIAKVLRLPMIVHFHGFDAHHIPTLSKYRKSYDSFLQHQPHIIAVSSLMKQVIMSWGVDEKNIIHSPCGCDSKFVEATIPNERNGFLTVGNFVAKKGPLFTIKAFAKALEREKISHLTMIGDGPLLEECKNWVKSNELEKHITFTGKLSHQEIFEWMKKSKIFLQHSITLEDGNKEGTPVAILEASGMKMPVISTKHAGINEVILQNTTGILVEEEEVDEMANAMILLDQNTSLCQEMGENGRSWVAKHFTTKHHLEKINPWIEQILEH
jgi:colanic acid/amylovoran biosynthesis glycosyltransferase